MLITNSPPKNITIIEDTIVSLIKSLILLDSVGSIAHALTRKFFNCLKILLALQTSSIKPKNALIESELILGICSKSTIIISYTHLRAHETDSYLVCRLLLE